MPFEGGLSCGAVLGAGGGGDQVAAGRGRNPSVFDGVFGPLERFLSATFWAVWVTSQGGAGEERFGVAPLLDRVTFRRCLGAEAIRSRCSDYFQRCALSIAQPVEVPLCEGHRLSVAAEERCEVGVVHPTV